LAVPITARTSLGRGRARNRGGIDLDAYRRLLTARNSDEADAFDLRQLLGEDVVGEVVDAPQRQRIRGDGEDENRRAAGLTLL